MNCEQYRDLLNRHLDGETAADALGDHAGQCADCAALYRGARRLAAALGRGKPAVPPGYLTKSILLELREDRRRRVALRLRMAATALAAAVLIVIAIPTFFWPRPNGNQQVLASTTVPNTQPATVETTATLRDTVNQAGQAFGQLTARTADETVGQGRSLWPMVTPMPLDDWEKPQIEPSTRPLTETGQSAVAAIEPVTNSARRAFDRFLHDLPPMDDPAKPGS
jgi:predicted anti-sigma-YlaC factor YlaD